MIVATTSRATPRPAHRRSLRRHGAARGLAGALVFVAAGACAQVPGNAAVAPFDVVGDAIPAPLAGRSGDATRGRAIVVNRQVGMCLLCHTGPFPEERFQGTLAPDLAGVGARLTEAQLRLRVVDNRRVSPASAMPAFHRTEGLVRVGTAWRDKPILDAQQVEDVVALLLTLRN